MRQVVRSALWRRLCCLGIEVPNVRPLCKRLCKTVLNFPCSQMSFKQITTRTENRENHFDGCSLFIGLTKFLSSVLRQLETKSLANLA